MQLKDQNAKSDPLEMLRNRYGTVLNNDGYLWLVQGLPDGKPQELAFQGDSRQRNGWL